MRAAKAGTDWLDEMNRTISAFVRIARSTRLYRQMSENGHADLPQHLAHVLYSIDRFENARMRDLVERIDSGPSGISRNISELEALGLVERTRTTHDRRAKTVTLTAEGHRVLQQMWEAWNQTVERVTEHWTVEQRAVFLALFKDFTVNFSESIDGEKD
jgi:DNA-binding MarR family transcriptional regulator